MYKYNDTVWLDKEYVDIEMSPFKRKYYKNKGFSDIEVNQKVLRVPIDKSGSKERVKTYCPGCGKEKLLTVGDILKVNSTICFNCPSRLKPYVTENLDYVPLKKGKIKNRITEQMTTYYSLRENLLVSSEWATIRISSAYTQHYKDKGYNFVKRFDNIVCHLTHLPEQTHINVVAICPACGRERTVIWKAINHMTNNTFCHSCANNGYKFAENPLPRKRPTDIMKAQWDTHKRHNFECQICGKTHKLNGHHIFGYKEYPELGSDESNLILLCGDCHYDIHSFSGWFKETNATKFKKWLRQDKRWKQHQIDDLWDRLNLIRIVV